MPHYNVSEKVLVIERLRKIKCEGRLARRSVVIERKLGQKRAAQKEGPESDSPSVRPLAS
jgi:hypothetical protein